MKRSGGSMPCAQQSWKFLGDVFAATVILHFYLEEVSHSVWATCINIRYELRLTLYFDQAECPRSAVPEPSRRINYLLNYRQVGVCLKHLPSSSAKTKHHFHDANVPWQRVINTKGIISPRSAVRTQGS